MTPSYCPILLDYTLCRAVKSTTLAIVLLSFIDGGVIQASNISFLASTCTVLFDTTIQRILKRC